MLRSAIKKTIRNLQVKSLLASNQERGERALKNQLELIIPDITNQYTTFKIPQDDQYLTQKIRCQHAFQTSMMIKTLHLACDKINHRAINVVDIGDSAGSHVSYMRALASEKNIKLNTLSINLDHLAIQRITSRGLSAKLCRAEDLHVGPDATVADIFMLFEVLEHLTDPITFLRTLATKAKCEFFLITVPYVKNSRVGLHHLRHGRELSPVYAENTHIFELNPTDWELIFRFSGWEVIYADHYTQYPKMGLLSPMKYIWRKYDFDGFYGVILKKNATESERYQDW